MVKHPLLTLLDHYTLTELANACGVTPQAVFDWKRKASAAPARFKLPARHVMTLARFAQLHPHALRPDLYEAHWKYKL
jgi:hypothetical protein